ncbi:hypothetical protein L1987_38894 [Smallanthus sonchifolius]|uniref:Uncharacterized protein n=1 Tax=Smallanthus sonchifolius TaxID=185202 RepID=A0ACB9HLE0_9ASTR|nr:hypothetical protein L1987_38894 [Smallanthus sonchifolius]
MEEADKRRVGGEVRFSTRKRADAVDSPPLKTDTLLLNSSHFRYQALILEASLFSDSTSVSKDSPSLFRHLLPTPANLSDYFSVLLSPLLTTNDKTLQFCDQLLSIHAYNHIHSWTITIRKHRIRQRRNLRSPEKKVWTSSHSSQSRLCYTKDNLILCKYYLTQKESKSTMKESSRRYINPVLSDKENDKVNLWNSNKVNFTTNPEDEKFEKSLEPSLVPAESLQKPKELYIDKNVTECQLPKFITCYEENCFNVVKDICVDEGLSHGEKIGCGKEHHELSCSPITVNGDKRDDMINDDKGTELISSTLEDYLYSGTKDDNVPSNCASEKIKSSVKSNIVNSSENFGSENSMQNGEEIIDSNSDSLNNSIKTDEPFKNSSVNDVDQQLYEVQSVGSEAKELRKTSQTVDMSNEIKTDENTISNSDNVKPAATVNIPLELPLEAENTPNHHDIASNNITVSAHGGGESSFSMTGPVLGLITYSGPITSSGSISHRSDGSNSSVRSFAFPILQNEWNSSPVRMGKVEQRQSPKHRGWRQTLMCCRF